MMRGLAVLLTVVLFVLPLLTTPVELVAAIGLVAAFLAAVGIIARWRWSVTAASFQNSPPRLNARARWPNVRYARRRGGLGGRGAGSGEASVAPDRG